mmetsp:Transcript_32333/g.81393  ORF Transcript_32333/g.81393 Transcript_32333/m.81393 type:complete len:246 (-) Transcript_32333:161-898(-)
MKTSQTSKPRASFIAKMGSVGGRSSPASVELPDASCASSSSFVGSSKFGGARRAASAKRAGQPVLTLLPLGSSTLPIDTRVLARTSLAISANANIPLLSAARRPRMGSIRSGKRSRTPGNSSKAELTPAMASFVWPRHKPPSHTVHIICLPGPPTHGINEASRRGVKSNPSTFASAAEILSTPRSSTALTREETLHERPPIRSPLIASAVAASTASANSTKAKLSFEKLFEGERMQRTGDDDKCL